MKNYLLIVSDFSFWILLVSNVITIYLAINQNWSIYEVALVYFGQSFIIGIFGYLKIINHQNFETEEGFKFEGKNKTILGLVFLIPYLVFHIISFLLIAGQIFFAPLFFFFFGEPYTKITLKSIGLIFLSILLFLANHWFSYFYNKVKDIKEPKKKIQIMFSPYVRIVPMHIIILIGILSVNQLNLLVFLILKTIADLTMHIIEHKKQT